MTDLEDRLRHDLKHIPERAQPGSARPPRAPSARRRSGALRWLAPVTATAAVIGIIAGASAADGATVNRQVTGGAPAGVPKYYVALTTVRPIQDFEMRGTRTIDWFGLLSKANTVATVRDTSTGSVLARLKPPAPYLNFVAVSAAASDRTFVLLAQGPGAEHQTAPQRFYLLRINPGAATAAKKARLTALPARYSPGLSQVQAMALAPNGRSLAVVLGLLDTKLSVFNLTTGTTRTSPTPLYAVLHQILPRTFTLSWAPDNKSLALIASQDGGSTGPRLARLAAPGYQARPYGKPVAIHRTGVGVGQWVITSITPDSKTAFLSYVFTRRTSIWVRLTRFSPATGKLATVNTLMIQNHGHGTGYSYEGVMLPDPVWWTSRTGQLAIVGYSRPGQTGGIYHGTTYTPIPWPASLIGAAW